MRRLPILSVLVLAALPVAAASDCPYSEPRSLELVAGNASELEIVARAGFLIVEGSDSATSVVVNATACASSEQLLAEIRLDSGQRGGRLWIEAEVPQDYLGWRDGSRLDLTVEVPSRLALTIRDGSGAIDIRHVGALDLEDGSGEIDIREVGGDVVLSDGSGSVRLTGVGGDVRITDDGSGEIEISEVRGSVEIGEDGSGGIRIRDVDGTVRIRSDGSGSISVARVGGDFLLGRDGSGSVHVEGVSGTVETP